MDEKRGPVLTVEGADLMDKTPIYDIKPYIPLSDCHPEASEGYTKETRVHELEVHFPEELLQIYPEEKRETVIGVLAQDPRPAYVQDPERIYEIVRELLIKQQKENGLPDGIGFTGQMHGIKFCLTF